MDKTWKQLDLERTWTRVTRFSQEAAAAAATMQARFRLCARLLYSFEITYASKAFQAASSGAIFGIYELNYSTPHYRLCVFVDRNKSKNIIYIEIVFFFE